jgi:hypothetical protein
VSLAAAIRNAIGSKFLPHPLSCPCRPVYHVEGGYAWLIRPAFSQAVGAHLQENAHILKDEASSDSFKASSEEPTSGPNGGVEMGAIRQRTLPSRQALRAFTTDREGLSVQPGSAHRIGCNQW